MTFADLPAAAHAACPLVLGIEGKGWNRSTWRAVWREPPTQTQSDAVQAVMDACLEDPAPAPTIPDGPTLSDWRVGLLLWGRRDELLAKVEAERAKGTILGKIADERVNYANNVLRAQLLQLAGVFGFTPAEIDESLWRADRVARGDLSGAWPLPATQA